MKEFFWLHIKKSAGQSTRAALGPLYVETDRRRPVATIQELPNREWNDALNNYRMRLGSFQFRRTEFARTVLWPENWESMLRVGFARNPLSRCLSMYSYLFDPEGGKHLSAYIKYLRHCNAVPLRRRLDFSHIGRFDAFLDVLEWQATQRPGPDPAAPIDLHFSTHTNPMSFDVLDDSGKLNLSHLIRLDCFEAGIDLCYDAMGLRRADESRGIRRNAGGKDSRYQPTLAQRRKIEILYETDFHLFENALVM